jgi:hypothetical protein
VALMLGLAAALAPQGDEGLQGTFRWAATWLALLAAVVEVVGMNRTRVARAAPSWLSLAADLRSVWKTTVRPAQETSKEVRDEPDG